jgi:hypothetical protein
VLKLGLKGVRVGFNCTPTFGASAEFWSSIGKLGGQSFVESLEYVGLDFFPDVFGPEPDLRAAVLGVMDTMRSTWLPAAGIPATVPIHVAECGWPTGPDRSEEKQADALEAVVRPLVEASDLFSIARYTAFSLRDSESFDPESADNLFYHFGLMRSNYSAKRAFETYRRLIAEFHRE